MMYDFILTNIWVKYSKPVKAVSTDQGLKHNLFVQENEASNKEPKIKMYSHFFWHLRGNYRTARRFSYKKMASLKKQPLPFMKIM